MGSSACPKDTSIEAGSGTKFSRTGGDDNDNGAGSKVPHGILEKAKQKTASWGLFSKGEIPQASERDNGLGEGEWDGVTWAENDENETDEAGSLANESLGTVEVASKASDGMRQPKDLLIALQGVAGLSDVSTPTEFASAPRTSCMDTSVQSCHCCVGTFCVYYHDRMRRIVSQSTWTPFFP